MKLDIISIIKNIGESIEFEMTDKLEVLDSGIGTVSFTGPVTLKGTATSFNHMIQVKGEAQIRYKTVCDRCGENLERHLTVSINENIVERNEQDQDAAMEDEDRFTYKGHFIELDSIVVDAILLNLPMQHLCSADCEGLCPTCGNSLNGLHCDCSEDQDIDPRLESLKSYFKK